MIHRTSSSRKRRGSRSAATSPHRGSPGTGARRPSMMVGGGGGLGLLDPAAASPPPGAARGRRASIAIGSTGDLAGITVTAAPADDDGRLVTAPTHVDSDPEQDDNCLMPELAVYNRSPRGSLVPQESNRSPRNSLTPDAAGYNRSPRNSLVPDTYSRSPRNSLVPDISSSGGGGGNRSARNSLVPTEYSRSPRGSLLPDVESFSRTSRSNLLPEPPDSYSRSPRNSLVPDYNSSSRSARNSLVPDISPSRSQRNSLIPDQPINKSPRGSLVPEAGATRSPRGSLVPEPTPNRSPRGSLVPEPGNNINRSSPRGSITSEVSFNKSPRNSLPLQDSASIRSPRGSITSAAGALIDTTRSPRGSIDIVAPGTSRGGVNRSPSPYRKSTRSANVNNAVEGGSRRASSSVSQASADDRRQLCGEHTKLNSDAGLGLSAYGSVVYQLNHANMESSGLCDFVCRALHIVYRTGVVFIVLGCLFTLPVAMFIIGIQYAKDCPKEPILPVYMIVGGGFGTIKMLWMLWNQYRSMTYERLDARSRSSGSSGDDPISTGGKITNFLLTTFLMVWFVMGNVWIWGMGWPDFKPTLLDPNSWCDKTLFLFALTHLVVLYSLIGVVIIVIIVLIASQVCVCPMLIHCK
ncbi:nascent polypeptide-associated complex subunit alpha, muscle-specific form-like isoform X2 [Nilaparvata lugens]|uniref:nascent polypeptide-associated complex subunit alpha, muscle-specific form-like isoform X2 n=1 Tax=Nilaparvata lugens TaxID=108931 RepID=UPI00193E13D1|nr:nascent polypeptide-associated complex subunit alpha, muscle-specific form-like isoform X2 [Nilaparvata lugens]